MFTSCCLSSQQKQLEIERAEKWLKMVKKWEKYRNSDRVSKRGVGGHWIPA